MEELSGFPVEIRSSIYNMNQWNSFPKMKYYLYQIYQIGVMLFVSVNGVDSFCVCVCWFCSVGLRILSHELQDGLPERIVRELKPEATGAES